MRYILRGVDAATGEPAQLSASAASLPDAAAFAAARGIRVESAESEGGRVARLEPSGEWRYLDALASPPDAGARRAGRVLSVLVPVVGLALVVAYIVKRDAAESVRVFLLALVGAMLWAAVASAALGLR